MTIREKDDFGALVHAHEEWLSALDQIRDLLVLHDGDFRILRANRSYAKRAGMAFHELLGKPIWEVFPRVGGPLGECARGVSAYIAGERDVVQWEEQLNLDPGESYRMRVYAIEGEQPSFLCILEDQTATRRADLEMQHREASFHTILEDLPVLICRWDTDGRITYVNDNYCHYFGKKREELEGHTFSPLLPEPDQQQMAEHAASLGPDKPVGVIEHQVILANGELRWQRWTDRCLFDEDGEIREYQSIGQDITDNKLIEAKLQRLNRTLATLSQVNSALVLASDEQQLLKEICRIIVETGGYRLAWVELAEQTRQQQLVAYHGEGHGHDGDPVIDLRHQAQSFGISEEVLANGQPLIINRLEDSPRLVGIVGMIRGCSLEALAVLPMWVGEENSGCLYVWSDEAEVFDAAVVEHLMELARDLGFGLHTLRTRSQRDAMQRELAAGLLQTVEAISLTVEKRDPYTAGHQHRVAELAVAIGEELGMAKHQLEGLRVGALIHDIGKIAIPSELLARPGMLSDLEFSLIQVHAQAGYDIMKGVSFPWPISEMILQHHERLDGSGYPKGLKGEQILPEAKILAVADSVEAMVTHRPYRPGLGLEAALAEIESQRGSAYDADAVDACLRLFRQERFAWEDK